VSQLFAWILAHSGRSLRLLPGAKWGFGVLSRPLMLLQILVCQGVAGDVTGRGLVVNMQ